MTMDDPQTAAMEYGAQTGWEGVDRQWSAAMRCAAGERALFTADADCGTARQLQAGNFKDRNDIWVTKVNANGRKGLFTDEHEGVHNYIRAVRGKVATIISSPAPRLQGIVGIGGEELLMGRYCLPRWECACVR